MITSVHNDRVKLVRALSQRKSRQKEGRFFIEGVRLIEDALQARLKPDFVFFTPTTTPPADERKHHLLRRLADLNVETIEVSAEVMSACGDTETPPGLLAVLPFPDLDVPARPSLVLIADALRDPGNLGTLLRSAAASNVGVVVLAPETVDAYNPKVVRGAMGAHFRVPIVAEEWEGITGRVRGLDVRLASAGADTLYTHVDWTKPCALIVGGEAEGASEAASNLATGRVRIPLARGVESLNAGVAGSVILFEVVRQRNR
jgi:TrmH family RNA methyltransferase